MIYSDNFFCFFKHVTQVGPLREISDLFLHLTPETSKTSFGRIHKTYIFTLNENKYIPTPDMRGERKAVEGIK